MWFELRLVALVGVVVVVVLVMGLPTWLVGVCLVVVVVVTGFSAWVGKVLVVVKGGWVTSRLVGLCVGVVVVVTGFPVWVGVVLVVVKVGWVTWVVGVVVVVVIIVFRPIPPSVVVVGSGGGVGGAVISCLSSHSDLGLEGLSGVEDIPSPQSSSSSGYLYFVLLFFPEVGVVGLSSSTSILFLAGDITSPLSRLMACPTSSALLTTILFDSHLLILSSSTLEYKVLLLSFLVLSSPSVSLPILHLLYSPFELRTMSSPSRWILTASHSCLVRAVPRNLIGLRWNFGSSCPP